MVARKHSLGFERDRPRKSHAEDDLRFMQSGASEDLMEIRTLVAAGKWSPWSA
jgi:hypothetical protein